MRKIYRNFLKDESGQAIVEFVLLAAVAISVVALLKNSLQRLTVSIWGMLGGRIGAPCPDVRECPPPPEFTL